MDVAKRKKMKHERRETCDCARYDFASAATYNLCSNDKC